MILPRSDSAAENQVEPWGMAKIIHPQRFMPGINPDHDGVVLILDPGTKDEITVVMPGEAAVAVGAELQIWGVELVQRAWQAIKRHSANEAKNSILVRVVDDDLRMDS